MAQCILRRREPARGRCFDWRNRLTHGGEFGLFRAGLDAREAALHPAQRGGGALVQFPAVGDRQVAIRCFLHVTVTWISGGSTPVCVGACLRAQLFSVPVIISPAIAFHRTLIIQ